ncbi:MAG: outer membrane scaffolding protein for murein synthesis (MipA/OmpV family) [Crocinitomicaceae bacterium]|jgi:outer membrane scaffolding protein for murein synthesis (MipA/OmpV family)
MTRQLLGLFSALSIMLTSLTANATLEVGLGAVVTNVPLYIGSDEAETFYVPFPYLRYRTEKITVDRDLIQGNLWKYGNWTLELSLGGAVKVNSEDSKVRQGMDDLDYILEVGPALNYFFLGDRTTDNALLLEFPLRVAISSDFTDARYRGVTFNPRLVWRRGYTINGYEVRPQVAFGVRSADSDLNNYFYGVESKFATSERSAYKGKAGYGGTQFSYSTAVLWDDWLVAGFMRYVNANGAAFDDSSLFKQDDSWVFGFAVAYLFTDK